MENVGGSLGILWETSLSSNLNECGLVVFFFYYYNGEGMKVFKKKGNCIVLSKYLNSPWQPLLKWRLVSFIFN